ncbi:dnaj heat shock n-terminal domain-containing protein [Plasmopara halstedii]|uniref:Dnaj heat shock n-terminal domain-containing protein n=1 Tax=Plasmopara halstedii TaxID=4781 RepID=A0A0P1AUZ1_PLAHL|nr:dnaj heat shock n-terminal domain-containing protein [Plasmopara halstedii]CEG46118.1 dnaj heat shock n-terminal domain-containing protein [Plasmopara halstedii]|eukprot:XP_024582487.1 dnaj heat shock n-terminal domain-containing protein [Plasmopara halstedii]
MDSGVWVFYYVQGEEGEERAHPNAFRLTGVAPNTDVTLADVLRCFPLRNPTAFHFRFRLNNSKGNMFYWLDVTHSQQKVPLASGRVICKLLRLERPQKHGLVFRRRPVLKWSSKRQGSSSVLGDSASSVQSSKAVQPLSESNEFYQPSSPAFDHGRPAKYSDRTLNGAETQHSNSSSRSSSVSGEKKVSRTGLGSSSTAPGNLEDFLSGGQQSPRGSTAAPMPSPQKKDVNLMSDSGWNDTPVTAASDFLSSMDPLAARTKQPAQSSPSKSVQVDPPKFDDDNGQTVGPVTMAEMEAHSKSTADGSNVYNPNLVDKSTKSDKVRRAMEERERQVQRDVERARDDLRKREEAVRNMAIMKDNANTVLGPRLKAWGEDNGRVKNIRTLLSTMHQVMWEDCKWTEVNMGKLIQPNDVKKHYRKAMIVVHPDKAGGRNADQLLIAERVFAALNTAWEDFQKTNPC